MIIALIISMLVALATCIIAWRHEHSIGGHAYGILAISIFCGFAGFFMYLALSIIIGINNNDAGVWWAIPSTLVAVWVNYGWLVEKYKSSYGNNT